MRHSEILGRFASSVVLFHPRGLVGASLVLIAACSSDHSADEASEMASKAGRVACQGDEKPPCHDASVNAIDSLSHDGVRNGTETDVDCGGTNVACGEGKACEVDSDCMDKRCETNRCAPARNDDGVKNGTETDVDCGGQSGNRCGEGLGCDVDSDCDVACNYAHKCIDAPSCKPHFGGDTCGGKPLHPGEFGDPSPSAAQESCCRSLPVPGFRDPRRPRQQVFVDKYEISAGRVRAFLEALAATNNGQADIRSWIAAHRPPLWNDSWNMFLPSGDDADIVVPRQPENPPIGAPWRRNVGTDNAFGSELYIYVHGNNCSNYPGSYGYPTFWYPDALLADRGELPRAQGFDENGAPIDVKDALDVKSMTCIPSAVLAAFCHWDGGQLATDEVLDFITGAPPSLGTDDGCGSRCAPPSSVQASNDSGDDRALYRFPFYADGVNHDGANRIATPGRVYTDVVRFRAGDEPWMDLHGNVNEVVLDVSGGTFSGVFGLKYRGIGYRSARLGGNAGPPAKFTFPEYKAAYSGGRCMRYK